MWKESWWLTKRELKMQIPGIIITLLVTILIGILVVPTINAFVLNIFGDSASYANRIIFDNHTFNIDSIIIDIIFLGLTPSFSTLFMWGPYLSFRTIKEDPFGKRLAVYRSLPISTNVLTASRILVMLSIFVLLSAAFYLTIILSVPAAFFDYFSFNYFLSFMLFWIGYALALGSVITYIESGTNGKVLFIFLFIITLCLIIVLLLVYQIWEVGVVEATILLISKSPIIPVIASIICSILGVITMTKLLKKRLLERDYL
ncbi:hypothetical protein SAMN04487943_105151 [Gracilibacillus orientalis]|uniref:ABC-2 family transporter protein n=1 Tax=Gracilibacillus orientalis TaxID=334253 RepID=A0A1I4LRZ1_9BACI|nr:hypothetical protein [Gracilibacillus orientalis]SFL93347.1 hypothetical protein SAMN04487943_105151 [Gracilibacillus orientalis]